MSLFDVYPLHPIQIEKAAGSYVWDAQGVRYLDMYGGHAVISIGHNHPHWVSRLQDQLTKISFYSNSVKLGIQEELAAKLALVSGKKDYQLFLINSGAEANENALKLASFHTGRKTIVTFTGAFHGRTSLAVSVTDNPAIIAPVNENPDVIRLPFNDAGALEEAFKSKGDSIAAVIIEGIQGVGGIHEARPDFLRLIRSLCDQYGAVYIADSVQCGYGRTGDFFAHDIVPDAPADIYTMAKGMGNGFPIGGCLIAPHIKPKYGLLGTTFGGNPLACAAALAVLEVMDGEGLMAHAKNMGNQLMQQLSGMEGVEQLRGRGLMIGFDVDDTNKHLRKTLLMENHVFTGEAKPNVVRLLPSLSIQPDDIQLFMTALQKSFAYQVA